MRTCSSARERLSGKPTQSVWPLGSWLAFVLLISYSVAIATVATAAQVNAIDATSAAPRSVAVAPAAMTTLDSVPASIARLLRAKAPAPPIRASTWRRVGGLYSHREFAPVWVNTAGQLSPAASALLQSLIHAEVDGLRPGDYPLTALASALEALRATPSIERVSLADVLLTASFAMHGEKMLNGRLDQRSVESARHLAPRPIDVDSALTSTLHHANEGATEFTLALHRMRPQSAEYSGLLGALRQYRELANRGAWTRVGRGSSLHPGDSSVRVPSIRARLAAEGFTTPGVALNTNVLYDVPIASAVALFQARHGLEPDSVVGPRTQAALDVPVERRVRQIEANLERLRWLPSRLGDRYLMVNIPAFRLDAFDGGQPVMSMNVVVGADYDNRGTPIFSDSMSYVEFAPYWNVPNSIASRELWPKQRKDPSYFRRNNYEVVNASWGTYVRQKPGPDNALGQVKFIFPNDFNVYLHDTPQKSLFAENVRAFSHGCIRVARPDALARFVLGVQGWDSTAVEKAMDGGERTKVDLREKLPVYIVYLTAFVRDGDLTFRGDVYGYDTKILAALRPRTQDDVGAVVERIARGAGIAP